MPETSGSISIREVCSKTETVDLTYKIFSCGTSEDARKMKDALDEFMKENYGAVTALDEK